MNKIIDIAMKYGYDSQDSFTKAFTRFHGVSPSSVRKDEFTVVANAKIFSYEGAKDSSHERYLHLTGQYFPVREQCRMLFRM